MRNKNSGRRVESGFAARMRQCHKGDLNSGIKVGTRVVVQVEGRTESYLIVEAENSAPSLGKISILSPLVQLLLDARVGEERKVITGASSLPVRLLGIIQEEPCVK